MRPIAIALWSIIGAAAMAAALSGCGAETPGVDFKCELGQLQGSWLARYTETSGTCGPIPDEVVVGGAVVQPVNCVDLGGSLTADRCEMSIARQCQVGALTVTTRSVVKQLASDYVEGLVTFSVDDGLGKCASTYELSLERL